MENEQIVIELKELLYMEFRRYLYRRKANVTAQSILLAIGYNINKLHHKIQAGRTGRHLFPLKQTAWFWQVKSKSWKRTFFQKRFIKVRLLVETEWKERIFRLKNGKKMLPHLWFPNHWCDSPDYKGDFLNLQWQYNHLFLFSQVLSLARTVSEWGTVPWP